VLVSWDDFAENFVRFYRGLPAAQPVPADAFILGLLHGQSPPPWLRLIPYPLPKHDALKGQTVLLFEVTPVQRPEAVTVHLTDYLLEMEQLDLAGKMAPALEQGSDYFPALVMLAYLHGKTGQGVKFSGTMKRITERLPGPFALDPEDRIRLAVVLWVDEHEDLARQQLQRCLETLDEPALRRLTPGALTDLLQLSATLGRAIPDPALRQLAADLQPPYLRKR